MEVIELGLRIPLGKIGRLVVTKLPCHICGRKTDIICRNCEEPFCEKCQAPYNQFSQIDYDCCESCYTSSRPD